jgi:hypothetical protein
MSQILTEIAIRRLKPSEEYETHWDSLPGFGVRVGRKSKTYVVVVGRDRRRITIGRFDQIKLADARKEAKRLLSSEPEEKIPNRSWQTARDEFLDTHYRTRAAYTKYQATRLLTKRFKALDWKPLTKITHRDIGECLAAMAATPSEQLHAYRAAKVSDVRLESARTTADLQDQPRPATDTARRLRAPFEPCPAGA